MWATLDEVARSWRPEPEASRLAQGRVRDGLVRGWATVAGPELQQRVAAELAREGLSLEPDGGWVPMAAYLRLHELIAELDHAGDGVAFANRWLRDVEGQVPAVARWPLKALGPRRGFELLPKLWPEAWGAPAPMLQWGESSCVFERFAGLPLGHPTFALLLALQFELGLRLLAGVRGGAEYRCGAEWSARLRW